MNEIERSQVFSFGGRDVTVYFSQVYIRSEGFFELRIQANFPEWSYLGERKELTDFRVFSVEPTLYEREGEVLTVMHRIPRHEMGFVSVLSVTVRHLITEFAYSFINIVRTNPMFDFLISFEKSERERLSKIKIIESVIERKTHDLIHAKDIEKSVDLIEAIRIENDNRIASERIFIEERAEIIEAEEKRKKEIIERSWQFLESIVPKSVLEDARKVGFLIVKNTIGEFHIPLNKWEFVKLFKSGVKECDYCLHFEDYSIPEGDEIAMKYTLLLSDPEMFILKANEIRRRHVHSGS